MTCVRAVHATARSAPGSEPHRRLPAPAEVTGVLLCGGDSRRMGTDKAELLLGGRTLIRYPLEVLRSVAHRVLLATGREARYGELGLESVLDSRPDAGPLAGLLAGLEAATTPWVAVLACDMPRAHPDALRRLLEHAVESELDVCMLDVERGTQPMFAVYRSHCAAAVRAALERGDRRMISFHADPSLKVGTLRAGELDTADPEMALNLNTPRDLADEVQRRKEHA